ncbi:DUF892 family protein [Brassicibacter mesophilus]|uniref:DUF892 family protein n=1 Tax=Brassicibacter mesophilus TaxID=745119 RepID=UPI003D2238B2
MVNLTQKEMYLLQDQKSHEELCVKKYSNYSNQAQDPQLKQLFSSLGQQEQQHLNTINQILGGQVPNVNQQQGQQSMQSQSTQMQSSMQSGLANQNDADLCSDLLATEKYISGTYDTAIFEFGDANIRQVLNHIQKEEQQHGEKIYNYMKNNGMYN